MSIDYLGAPCPVCEVGVWEYCVTKKGKVTYSPHRERVTASIGGPFWGEKHAGATVGLYRAKAFCIVTNQCPVHVATVEWPRLLNWRDDAHDKALELAKRIAADHGTTLADVAPVIYDGYCPEWGRVRWAVEGGGEIVYGYDKISGPVTGQ